MLTELEKYAHKRIWWRADIRNIRSKLAQCERRTLSPEQKKAVQAYWKGLIGKPVPLYWHEYFYSRNGCFSEKYVPTAVYHRDLICRLNFRPFARAYVDKGFYDTLFADVHRPRTIIKNMNGYFFDAHKALTREEALARCASLPGAVIKPSLMGMWGNSIRVFSSSDGKMENGETVASLLDAYDSNFIVQEKVVQHAGMAQLNPTSLNTLRVLSYRQGTEVFILYVIARIGRKGKSIDNETAGGINADVDLITGRIRECAYGSPAEKRILQTDVGTPLAGFPIPAFAETLQLAKELHLRMPYFNLIGWDFGIDEKGLPVMIEWNRAPDLSQTAHGPAFGELTETIVREAQRHPDTFRMIF